MGVRIRVFAIADSARRVPVPFAATAARLPRSFMSRPLPLMMCK